MLRPTLWGRRSSSNVQSHVRLGRPAQSRQSAGGRLTAARRMREWSCDVGPSCRLQVVDRGTTFRYGGQLRTKQTLKCQRISSRGGAAAESSERGGGRRVAPATATKYPHALRRLCDMASLRRLAVRFFNQRLGEGHPDRKNRGGQRLRTDVEQTLRMASAFARQAARGTHCPRHSMTDATTRHLPYANNNKRGYLLQTDPVPEFVTTEIVSSERA